MPASHCSSNSSNPPVQYKHWVIKEQGHAIEREQEHEQECLQDIEVNNLQKRKASLWCNGNVMSTTVKLEYVLIISKATTEL